MPIYEYQCQACGHQLEALQKISEAPLTDCPSCAANELRKMISAPAFRLKGGGWYETDFKAGDRKKNLASDDKPAAKPAEKKADGGSGDKGPGGSGSCAAA